jgi:hypothetical protein
MIQLADPSSNLLGDFLKDLIIFGIQENNLTYTGGIDDENRTGDPIEPDTQ